MSNVKDIPKERIASDSQFHSPIDRLINNIREYYQREFGISLNGNEIEKQIIKIVRSRL